MKENNKPVPPHYVDRFLEWFLPEHLLEDVQGDLHEVFYKQLQQVGRAKATKAYFIAALRYIRPYFFTRRHKKPSSYTHVLFTHMLSNYLTIAFRHLVKNKGYSLINIGGLAVGMTIALLIGLWIGDELSFNHYHQNYDQLTQVMATQTFDGETHTGPNISVPIEKELRTNYAGDVKGLSLTWTSTNILAVSDKKLSLSGRWAQPDLPKMLTLTMLQGSREAFNDPSSVLLSESVARALFGEANAVNQTIRVDNRTDMKVAGVYQDLPRNTTFYETKFLLPWDNSLNDYWNTQTDWSNHGSELFVQLHEQADIEQVTAKIKKMTQQHGYKGSNEQLLLHPMSKWHLYNEFKNGKVVGGRIEYVYLISIIGGFVLLLACINFMNLSTARSEKRAKEVGIRKAVGSLRGQLIGQFLSESLLVAFLSLVFSLLLIQLSLPFFNTLADKQMLIPWANPGFWLLSIGFTFFTGLVSGSYPAFYLSGFNPVKVLKGTFRAGRFATLPRKVLVVVQFIVSITLIIGTIIVYRQIDHAKNRPVGYSREGLISIVMNTPEIYQNYNGLRHDLIATGAVEDMAQSNSSPTQIWSNNGGMDWPGKDPNSDPLFGTIAVTHDFGRTVGWQIVDGRDFSRDFPTDSGAFILNESAVKLTGMKNPVGQSIKWLGENNRIVGIVKDMVMASPYQPTVPTIFHMRYSWVNMITVRIKQSMPMREALAKVEEVFRKYNPGSPFDFQFVDELYARKFADERRIGHLATLFAVLTIFISCLGLFGMASFMAEQRTKEIGVRRVLGASTFNLWGLLSKDFVYLVLTAFLIATPIAYYFLAYWLENYEYRTDISWWIFAIAGTGALLITLLTVSYQAIKAALANPVNSLRNE